MIEFLIEHAGFVVITSFILYALCIYKLVDVLKKITKDIKWLKPYRVAMATVIGGATGPLAYPFLFELLKVDIDIPIAFSIILGVGTGAVAVNIHNYIDGQLKRE